MRELLATLDLAQIELSLPAPKPTTLTEGQVESSARVWKSDDGTVQVGVWECSPGRFTADRSGNSEICYIISGLVEMKYADGRVVRLGAGDSLVLPQGWKGEWNILALTRKMYVTYAPGPLAI